MSQSIDIFPWDDHFNTGLPTVDAQHQKLVQLLNQLASQMAFAPGGPGLARVFEELQDYAVYHFQDEEAIWARYLPDDPLEAEHRAGHQHFFDTVVRLRANASEQSAVVITEQVLEFLARWLASHILETDRHMAATVLGLQAGLDMATAKQRADTKMAGSTRALIDIILSIYGALSTNTVRLMREIHEHQQSVAALKASEARMRSLFEKAPLPYQSLDMAGHVLEVNAAWQTQMGYTREEVLGRFVGDFIADESMGTLAREFPAFQARGRTDGPVFEMVRKDGSRFLWQVNGRIAQDENGASSQTHCLLTDITEQQRIQQQLDHLGRHQQLLLDLSTTFINLPLAQVDSAIQSALGKMAHFVNADRAYLFNYDFERQTASNTHEWCAPGITPQLGAFQQVPLDSIPDWVETHRQGQPLLIADVEAVPPGPLREWLLRQHIQSLAALPLMGKQDCLGFMGFDAVHQHHTFTEQELQLLHLFATLLAHLRDRQHMESELSRERSFLKTLVHTIPDLMWLKDTQGVYLSCNPRFEQMFHASEAQIVGKTDFDFVDEATACSFRANDELAIGRGRPTVNEEWVNFSAEGLGKWIETTKTPMFSADGTLLGVLGLGRDITERKAAEDRLQLAASVFTHASEGIMITTPEGVLVEVNDAFTSITGYGREEALGQSTRLFNSGRQHPGFYEAMWQTLKQQGHWSGEIWNRRKSGEVYAELLNINAVRDAQGQVLRYVGLFSDISKQKEHEHRLEHIAHYDALTGLPNRVLLADRLRLTMAQSLRRGQSLAIVFLDLDGFKAINDTHGHEMGDKLLVALSNRMQKSLRDGDTLARLGGDEFVAVLTDLAEHDAAIPALERLRNAAAVPFVVEGTVLEVTASLGVTFYPQPADMDAEQLMRQADQAMYQAKLAGKNRFHLFDTEHDLSIRGHNEIQHDIRQGLKTQAFELLYQPKVNMRTGALLGAEALLRWQHPVRGQLPPHAFMPSIQSPELLIELSQWVLRSALTQIQTWKQQGLHIPVSVNIDATSLQQPHFVDALKALLTEYPQVNPGDLELEILETSALDDIGSVSQLMNDCRAIGIGFALDDFGTGYSSLTYLRRLPASVLKIDQSFVRDMLDDPDDMAILEGVLGLARAFRTQVIAEGVETPAHGQMLLRLGCEWGQGYAIAPPMPAGDLPAWLTGWQPDASWLNVSTAAHEDLPLLTAMVEHRAWVADLTSHVQGQRSTPPPLDVHSCRFGRWLHHQSNRHRLHKPDQFASIDRLHNDIHQQAAQLVGWTQTGQTEHIAASLPALRTTRDDLLDHMMQLLD